MKIINRNAKCRLLLKNKMVKGAYRKGKRLEVSLVFNLSV